MDIKYTNGDIPYVNYLGALVLFPVELFFGCFVVYFYIKIKSFRKKPSDLFFMMAIFDIICSVYKYEG